MSLALSIGQDPAKAPLPGLREDLHVQRVGTFHDGSPRYRIHDALRNKYFELGLFDVEMLAQWRAGDNAAVVAQRTSEQVGAPVDPQEVLVLRDFLVRHQLVDTTSRADFMVLQQMWQRRQSHWAMWLLHHYLFFRLPLVRPDAWLVRMLPVARRLVSAPALVLLAVLAVVTPFLLAREWNDYTEAFAGLLTFNGIVASAAAAFFAKILHELGHAFVARHYGVRVPVMGLAFLVLWPVLYTDTSDSWKLQDHKARFRIAAAGIVTELAIALVCLFLWTLAPPGGLRSALFFLSTTSILITLSINASPFMRFDGYFLLSDALDFPNLHERSGDMARWWTRRLLWGLQRPAPESNGRKLDTFLIAFALMTWTYRAVVFLGIAALVYYAFFKLLGILLMLVEVGWFIFRPVVSEGTALWKLRKELHPRWLRLAAVVCVFLGGLTLFAWSGESRAPALRIAAEESRLYAPSPARIGAVHVRPGQGVQPGQTLIELQAPDLAYRAQASAIRIERTNGELSRIPASDRQRERALVLQEELAQALAEQQAVASELALMTIRATHAGRVVDMPPDLVPGRWVSPKRLLGRVVDSQRAQVRAWVSETQVRRLHVGDEVSFVPRHGEESIEKGRIVRIDTTGSRVLPHPLLEGRHGGDLTATADARGEWQLRETIYQVDVQLAGPAPQQVEAGRLVVPTGVWESLASALRHGMTVLVRESSF
ncbi:HlyD family efflux transporter periplasmic adaptor subunit [Ramlibacter albus]|uniref:HlyD family efflux transporter periplasmic adaptor subunit n=1 Tax=Ramlibacter albus TaxID=2079448 RepID=A0A923M348_9BURK|nr:HlyD family efflux transporter periplasmic adaptor subunit [Ramlibacter albus]MBC5763287.1 HlyD family efflux transporter periplasmic adaptor subunit [Ramlibacter albus]